MYYLLYCNILCYSIIEFNLQQKKKFKGRLKDTHTHFDTLTYFVSPRAHIGLGYLVHGALHTGHDKTNINKHTNTQWPNSQSESRLPLRRTRRTRLSPADVDIPSVFICACMTVVVGVAGEQIHVFLRSRVPPALQRASICR